MNLTTWHPRSGHPIDLFRREMDNMLREFLGGDGGGQHGVQHWVPQVDMVDRGKELLVKVDLPGVEPKDVDITAEDGMLTICGHREEEKESNENNVHRVERFSGRFFREVPLPQGTDLNRIQANSSQGVLTITIPKKAEVQPRRIQVNAGGDGGAGGQAHQPAAGAKQEEGGAKKAEAQPNKGKATPQS